ncbi:unnamed protein product [Bursaphelenchus xylophilus]|uniref:(pine wood nematode) hypothetical protein n=1 Tax=Bursaphelenchus xylophilus TaxID=6326 RepID=A0A1I7SVA3_BURXY|nr:unnamed protein product [Bursaphelenchus xylophilus]CAG9101139.1 unnamed protein product [Bursaphelenchus xylophilus]
MCSLCHSVISHFQESKMKDGKAFKEQLFMSCTLLRSPEEIDKCREDIDDEKLKQLDTKTVEEMCVEQKMCKKNEKPREFRTTLEVKTQTPISSNIETAFYTSKHGDSNGFKQFNSADSKAPLFFTVILTALAIFRR